MERTWSIGLAVNLNHMALDLEHVVDIECEN